MNKLDALRVLSRAYWHILNLLDGGDYIAANLLAKKFHEVRRSLQSLDDLEPPPVFAEGLNGKGPTWF